LAAAVGKFWRIKMATYETYCYASQMLALLGFVYLMENYIQYAWVGLPCASVSLATALTSPGMSHATE
jgi:hypothetical protein